jgi:hypothetical protein
MTKAGRPGFGASRLFVWNFYGSRKKSTAFPNLVPRHAREIMGQDFVGIRPVALLVREVVGPDEAVEVEVMTVVDAGAVALETPVEILVDQLRRLCLQWRDAVELRRPGNVAGVTDIGHLEEVRQPPDRVLGAEDAQGGKAVEDAREDQLHGVEAGVAGKARHLGGELGTELGIFERVIEQLAVGLGALDHEMDRHRHVEIERRRPEAVVLRLRPAAAVRVGEELHADVA